MKQTTFQRFLRFPLILVLGIVLGLGAFAQTGGQGTIPAAVMTVLDANGFVSMAKNSQLELFAAKDTGFVAVWSASEQKIWYSSPLNWEDDQLSSGGNHMAVGSGISLRKADNLGTIQPVNSIINVVRRDGLTIEPIENGFRFNYDYPRDEIFIPVEFVLDADSLLVRIPLKDVKEPPKDSEDNKFILNRITLQPYFGAQGMDQTGFMVIPDGSGALIKFNNMRSKEMVELPVYGEDPSIDIQMKRDLKQKLTLPVFGLSTKDGAFIGVIEDGAGRSIINAETGGQRTGYNSVSATYIYRELDVVTIAERVGTNRDMRLFDNRSPDDDAFAVRYIFLPKDKTSYADMALRFQKYLADKSLIRKSPASQDNPMMVSVFGGGQQVRPVLGIPMEVTTPYTTFDDAQAFLQKLKDGGIKDLVLNYRSWVSGGDEKNFPDRADPEGGIGGEWGMKKFNEWTAAQGIKVFYDTDLVRLFRSSLGFMKEIVSARRIFMSSVEMNYYKMSTFAKDDRYSPVPLLRPMEVVKALERFLNNFKRFENVGVGLSTMGSLVYSDFDVKEGMGRNKIAQTFGDSLRKTADQKPVLLDSPLGFALAAPDYITSLPSVSSRYDIADEMIPFYQIALRGYIPYSLEAGNTATNLGDWTLRCLEYGAQPYFDLVFRNVKELPSTRFVSLFDRDASVWTDDALAKGKEIQGLLEQVKGQPIVAHQIISRQVHVTTYGNGVSFAVNYSNKPTQLEGNVNVPARGYAVFRGSK